MATAEQQKNPGRPALSEEEKAEREAARQAENERLAALRESDPEAYKAERERMRREAFVRVATRRTNAALKALDMITPLANKGNYKSEPDEVEKILAALDSKFEEVVAAFKAEKSKDEPAFTL